MWKMMKKKILFAIFLSLLCYVNAEKGTRNEKVEKQSNLKAAAPKIGTFSLVTDTLSPCKIRASWTCPSCGTFANYVVQWEESEDPSVVYSKELKNTVKMYDIDQLISSKNYTIRVLAVSSEGDTVQQSDDQEAITDEGEPQNVRNFEVGDVTDSKISVSWSNSTNECPIEGFRLIWYGEAIWDEHRHSGSEYTTKGKSKISYTISSLMPYSTYDIEIQEVATDLKGGTNSSGSATTSQRAASAPKVRTFALSSSSINVSWEAPSSPNGVITGYNVHWAIGGDDDSAGSYNTSEEVFSYIITDLIACATYDINVAAINAAGIGSSSTVQNSTEEEKSPAPGNLECTYDSTAALIVVTWDLVDASQTKCSIDHYSVEYRKEILWTGEVTQPKNTLDSTETEYSIVDVPPYTLYEIEVSAYTSKLQGNISYCEPITTNQTAPGAPIIVGPAIGTETNTSITIVWNDPVEKNGALETFNVALYNNETDDVVETKVSYTNFTDAFYVVTYSDLEPFIDYTVHVSAENGFGSGPDVTCDFMLEEYEEEEEVEEEIL